MRKISCGVSGTDHVPNTHKLSEIRIRPEIIAAFQTFYKGDLTLRPAQELAIFDKNLLWDKDNVIIATPTNSGKSLLSYLLLFQDAAEGKNVILAEPLRALAYEKAEELKQIADILKRQSQIRVKITISTGDYRLTDEFMNTRPKRQNSGQGCIIVATPERLDAVSRTKENIEWFNGVSLVCFDEAHLIGDRARGPVMELLIAFLRTLRMPPRIVLMSATISNPEDLSAWLSPCGIINAADRYPQLEKWVYCVEEQEDANQVLCEEIREILKEDGTGIIVFVYQTAAAESLANTLAKKITGRKIAAHDLSAAMDAGVAWFHAKLSAATKKRVIDAMENGSVRVTVSTTALSMGINLPATHVFVRDITFTGFKDLDVAELLQMTGRAGRGNRPGTGVVMLSKSNLAKEYAVVNGLTGEVMPTIKSALLPIEREDYYGSSGRDPLCIDRIGSQVIGALNRFESITKSGLKEYLQGTLCGNKFSDLDQMLWYLTEWKLVYQEEITNEYALTALGKAASRCYFPPLTAANMGFLIRDLLLDQPSGKHIAEFAPIDYIIMICLVSNEFKPISRYGKRMETGIADYMEALPLDEKSYLYRTWIAAKPENLWGSARAGDAQRDAKRQVYQRVYTAMFIYDLSMGKSSARLKDFYKTDADEIQERLRDTAIWLICGMERLLSVRCFYYHLKEICKADEKQIRSVDAAFKKASGTAFSIVGNLKFRSKLGELVRGIKRVYPHAESYPGEGTIRRLEAAGITSLKDLVRKSPEDLIGIGIQRKYADLIAAYVRKRLS